MPPITNILLSSTITINTNDELTSNIDKQNNSTLIIDNQNTDINIINPIRNTSEHSNIIIPTETCLNSNGKF